VCVAIALIGVICIDGIYSSSCFVVLIYNLFRQHAQSHVQNSKKRLYTILRCPTKPNHIKALASHFHIIKDRVDDIYIDSNVVSNAKNVDGSSVARSVDLSVRDVASIIAELKCCCDETVSTTKSVDTGDDDLESFDMETFEDDNATQTDEDKLQKPRQAKASKMKESIVFSHKTLQVNGRKTGLLLP
jgi:hypothetical protein